MRDPEEIQAAIDDAVENDQDILEHLRRTNPLVDVGRYRRFDDG